MPEKIQMLRCCICKRSYYTEEDATACEKKHENFSAVCIGIMQLFNDFFPVIAIRSYFSYCYGTYSNERVVLLGYDCNRFNFEEGTINISFKMIIRDKIEKYVCQPAIDVEIDDPLQFVREFMDGKRDKLSFMHQDRTHINACDWLALPPK